MKVLNSKRSTVVMAVAALKLPSCAFCRGVSRQAAFAGGFGAKKAASTKPRKKRSKIDLDDISVPPTAAPASQFSSTEPTIKLDKWGLPPPTEEDIFPLLPENTALIPAFRVDHSLEDIGHAMKGYIPLTLDRFDADAVEKEPLDDRLPMKLRLLHQSPPVLAIDNFLTPEECMDIERVAWPSDSEGSLAQQQDQRRPVQVTSQTFDLALSRRTSTSWFCYFSQVPLLMAKMQYMLGMPLEQLEEPQIVQYQAGQEFSWHYDEVPAPQLANGGQRLATLLVYLNTLPEDAGGGTVFRDLKDLHGNPLSMRPVQGSALLFFPADSSGRPDDRTLHKGQVVAETYEKRIIQVWTHERAFQARLPPGNRQGDARDNMDDASRQLGYIS